MEEITAETEIPEISLEDFTYGGKTLAEWETDLTVSIPSMPAQALEVNIAIRKLNEKYQLSYNCYAEFKTLCSAKNARLSEAKHAAIARLAADYRTNGAKPPGKDILESLALATPQCKALGEDSRMYDLIMDFFECHKIKLERVMSLFTTVSYSTRVSDKMHDTGAR